VRPSGRLALSYGIGGGNFQVTGTSTTVPLNTWTHVAVTRSGTTVRFFVNGVQDANTPTVSGTLHNNPSPLYVGVLNPGEGQYWLGNISNARVVKGVAVYTTGFTPSTFPLTAVQSANVNGNPSAAITAGQTSLLMNFTNIGMQNNTTFADVSTITATATVTGAPYYAGLTPFTNAYPGSIRLGSANYLTFPSNAAYNLSNGIFTFEAWIYMTSIPSTSPILSWGNGSYATFRIAPTGINFEGSPSSSLNANFPSTITTNTWYHVALVRSSTSTVTAYLNGVAGTPVTSLTSSNTYGNASNTLSIGFKADPQYFNGYVSNYRLVKGVAVYTSNFTPSTLPLPATQSANVYGNPSAAITGTQTSLLVPGTTGGFQDLSRSGQRITNTTSTTSVKTVSATQQFKFGTQSNTLLPTAYQTVIDATSLQYGTGDFTIEGWIYTNTAGVLYGIINKGASTPTGWSIEINTSNQLIWYSSGTAVKTSTDTIPATTWTYFAISRSGSNLYMFINGTLQGTAGTDSTNYNQTNNMIIGATRALGNGLNGFLDDLRITKGIARYTASFAAPTAAFPTS